MDLSTLILGFLLIGAGFVLLIAELLLMSGISFAAGLLARRRAFVTFSASASTVGVCSCWSSILLGLPCCVASAACVTGRGRRWAGNFC